MMIRRIVTLPELGLVAGTRAALGAGVALLLADKLTPESRRAVGWTLVGVGVISTFPLLAQIFLGDRGGSDPAEPEQGHARGQESARMW
jgi:hypothetical protein